MLLNIFNFHAGLFHQVKRRLEVEDVFSLFFKNGDGATEGQKPMASLSHTDGKSKIVVHIIQHAVFKYSRSGRCITVFLYFIYFLNADSNPLPF